MAPKSNMHAIYICSSSALHKQIVLKQELIIYLILFIYFISVLIIINTPFRNNEGWLCPSPSERDVVRISQMKNKYLINNTLWPMQK